MDNTKIGNCPICNLESQKLIRDSKLALQNRTLIECERCGPYAIDDIAKGHLRSEISIPKLIAWIREKKAKGIDPPIISDKTLESVINIIPDYTPSEKQLILMRNIEILSKYPGDEILLDLNVDYPISWASNQEEFIFYLRSLIEREVLVIPAWSIERSLRDFPVGRSYFKITAKGWDYLDANSKTGIISDQVFVAMSFNKDLNPVWENAIKKGIEDAGYKAYRVDDKPHSERIDVKIMTEIKNSKFLIADVTEQKRGVYFEAGYALGLGIPVIWACREDDSEHIHFDTKQYNHIFWEKEEKYREELYNFICAIIGKNK